MLKKFQSQLKTVLFKQLADIKTQIRIQLQDSVDNYQTQENNQDSKTLFIIDFLQKTTNLHDYIVNQQQQYVDEYNKLYSQLQLKISDVETQNDQYESENTRLMILSSQTEIQAKKFSKQISLQHKNIKKLIISLDQKENHFKQSILYKSDAAKQEKIKEAQRDQELRQLLQGFLITDDKDISQIEYTNSNNDSFNEIQYKKSIQALKKEIQYLKSLKQSDDKDVQTEGADLQRVLLQQIKKLKKSIRKIKTNNLYENSNIDNIPDIELIQSSSLSYESSLSQENEPTRLTSDNGLDDLPRVISKSSLQVITSYSNLIESRTLSAHQQSTLTMSRTQLKPYQQGKQDCEQLLVDQETQQICNVTGNTNTAIHRSYQLKDYNNDEIDQLKLRECVQIGALSEEFSHSYKGNKTKNQLIQTILSQFDQELADQIEKQHQKLKDQLNFEIDPKKFDFEHVLQSVNSLQQQSNQDQVINTISLKQVEEIQNLAQIKTFILPQMVKNNKESNRKKESPGNTETANQVETDVKPVKIGAITTLEEIERLAPSIPLVDANSSLLQKKDSKNTQMIDIPLPKLANNMFNLMKKTQKQGIPLEKTGRSPIKLPRGTLYPKTKVPVSGNYFTRIANPDLKLLKYDIGTQVCLCDCYRLEESKIELCDVRAQFDFLKKVIGRLSAQPMIEWQAREIEEGRRQAMKLVVNRHRVK
ncbi:hypothetical protein SS50377_21877 [Spironucleus salmonicida]|uniref:Uncharacterized protein n=1 Tax=Spironucleus salmonicida TaxID=348837 RepID=V6LUD2_9EUKA|nr:hypothetical protein SS50377_21877 [Spironucleus salmonicida]|eukprot:EST44419.1 Hypothetical protein SS50377_15725 [Spironucleus salmonicida]